MKNTENGFTLIELMVAMAMAGIVAGVIYTAYNIQTKIYTEQDKTAEMQQNIRAGISYLQREARMAGYNPQDTKHASCNAPGKTTAVAPGIHTATATKFGFSMNLNGEKEIAAGETLDCADDGENVTYALYTDKYGIQVLGRNDNTDIQGQQAIAQHIENIDFIYIFSPPLMGSLATPPTSVVTNVAQLDDIASVQVSLLARASTKDRKTAKTTSFTVPIPDAWGRPTANPPVWQSFTDNYSRRFLTTTINCRNTGLN